MKMSMFAQNRVRDIKVINQMRVDLGMVPVKMGFKNCFKCGKHFFSEDLRNKRSCDYCREESHVEMESRCPSSR